MLANKEAIQEQEGVDINFYEKALNKLVIDTPSSSEAMTSAMQQYIAAFSMYMLYNNNAYRYNLPYLTEQHKKFVTFIKCGSEKGKLLKEILDAIKASTSIQKFIKEKPEEAKNVKICLNEFLEADLNGTISLHKTFSFAGAQRDLKDDILTVLYNEIVRTYRIASKINVESGEIEEKYSQIVEKIEKLLGLYKGLGGTVESGNAKRESIK